MVKLSTILLVVGAVLASGSFLQKPKSSKTEKVTTKTKTKTEKSSSKKDKHSVLTRKATASEKVTAETKKITKTKKTSSKKAVVSVSLESKDLRALWEGRDFPEEKLPLKDIAISDKEIDSPGKRNVHIFGLQASGTSLLRTLLYANFGRRLNYFDSEVATTTEPNKSPGLWMFSNFKELARVEKDAIKELSQSDVYTIAVVRNPYSWLQAMRTGPPLRCLAECTTGDDWLVSPCIHNSPGGPDSVIQRMEYQSLAGLWNHWTEGYAKAAQFGFSKSMVITYEDLVTNPEAILDQLLQFLELKKTSEWIIPFEGEERDEQFDIQVGRKFMNGFIQKEKQQACVHLDPDVLEMLDYKVFDCQDFTTGPSRAFVPGGSPPKADEVTAREESGHNGSRPLAPGEKTKAEEEPVVLERGPQHMKFDEDGPKPMFGNTMMSKQPEPLPEEEEQASQEDIA